MAVPDIEALKQRAKRIWALGDYTQVERLTGQAARPLVDACAVSAGQEVLDVAAGSGNAALAAAREGARVVACDITPAMLELGRARSSAEGFEIEWVEADAEELPFADESFECVLSTFGVMLVPRPEVAVRESFRVLRPGGTFGITAWTPDSMIPAQSQVVSRYLPPPPGTPAPSDWGDASIVRELLGAVAGTVETQVHTAEWVGASPEEYVSTIEQKAGPQVAAREALPPERWAELRAELLDLARARAEGEGPVTISFEYLLVVARKRG